MTKRQIVEQVKDELYDETVLLSTEERIERAVLLLCPFEPEIYGMESRTISLKAMNKEALYSAFRDSYCYVVPIPTTAYKIHYCLPGQPTVHHIVARNDDELLELVVEIHGIITGETPLP